MLELLFKYPDSDASIVKIDDGFYYFGDGLSGGFAWTHELFLKWLPDIPLATKGERVPDQVLDFLEVYADKAAEEMGKLAEELGTSRVGVFVDSQGNVERMT